MAQHDGGSGEALLLTPTYASGAFAGAYVGAADPSPLDSFAAAASSDPTGNYRFSS